VTDYLIIVDKVHLRYCPENLSCEGRGDNVAFRQTDTAKRASG